MCAGALRYEREAAPGADGALTVEVDGRGLRARRQRAPLRLFRPRPARGEPPLGVIANVSGGVLGGDRLEIGIDAAAGALIAGQAAEKVYRSAGRAARMRAALTARGGAALEWLPQATILFDGAMLDRETTIRAEPDARCLAGEILVFGRVGMGERLARGAVRDMWRVERRGRPLWIDALQLEGDIGARLAAPDGFAGARCLATAIYIGADADADARLGEARAAAAAAPGGLRAAATVVNGVLIARWLGADPAAVRAAFGAFWAAFRAAALGRPPQLPAIWRI